ncbi:MAG TPA: mandelate racemase/muconate lactonizing enzyme family protein [Steroidobacteraceae bacterium]|nr:mandelate racemase/muconate lactonizing enzyme family protein [Steroidobacteraceae bacterium]
MRIADLKIFRADGGWRPLSFLRVRTDTGLCGWSEFAEALWAPALAESIQALGNHVAGADPRAFGRLSARLRAMTQFTAGGLVQQAVGAIENACLDIAAKAAGVPVYALFGGAFRQEAQLYWSHCGSFRLRHPELFEQLIGQPRIRGLPDLTELGREARSRGYQAVKTNPMAFGAGAPTLLNPGFAPEGLQLERTLADGTLRGIVAQCRALQEGLGADCGLMLDCNFSLHAGTLRHLAQALEPLDLKWLEADLASPAALAQLRAAVRIPIASLESLYGRRAYLPYLEAGAVDVAVVDVLWNGLAESVRIAALAENWDVNVAPHNFYGPLADLMSAHFCAAVPNLEIMEIEGDDVPWKYQLLTRPPQIERGRLRIPEGPGWGADIDERAVATHPWTQNT